MRRRRPARPATALSCGIHRQGNDEYRSPRSTVEFDQTAMAADEILRYPQPESGAVGAAGNQRIKNGLAELVEDARPVVLELNRRHHAVAVRADADVARRPGPQDQARRFI